MDVVFWPIYRQEVFLNEIVAKNFDSTGPHHKRFSNVAC